ncbi:nitroreductase family protein [Sphingomonas sp. ID0503]|uniref:nitroreductase family protein n=1 Tax=Sphingomonas sp. ID0503 TaxID=3399691 RepID=UPI003AFB516F
MFNDLSSPAALIASRRSGKPRDMVGPGPSEAELRAIIGQAARVPDHGKLFPWRFHIITDRDAFENLLTSAFRTERNVPEKVSLQALKDFARQGEAIVCVTSVPVQPSAIPLWEQELSAGAACLNLLYAVHAAGYVGCWLTGWPSFSETVRDAFDGPGSRIAGFIFIGSPGQPLEERPRPTLDMVVKSWPPKG